ncbi:MAG: hypothetical protein P4L87_25220 [Formivibrio sp.]|nr:hypothetical protein [Formivibrio sp.]
MTATALPAASVATNSSATEADVKNWLNSLHDYLAGLLGTTGVAADALAALGLAGSIVSTFNGRTGAVSLSGTDVSNALGYTPANNVAHACTSVTTHTTIDGGGGVSTYWDFNWANGGGTTSLLFNYSAPSVGGSCIHPHSLVLVENGSYKFAMDIRPGDWIKTNTGQSKVLGIWQSTLGDRPMYSINGMGAITSDHPISTIAGWAAIDPAAYELGNVGKIRPVKTRAGMVDVFSGTIPAEEVMQLQVGDTVVTEHGNIIVETITPFSFNQQYQPVLSLALESGDYFFADGIAVSKL